MGVNVEEIGYASRPRLWDGEQTDTVSVGAWKSYFARRHQITGPVAVWSAAADVQWVGGQATRLAATGR